MAEQEFLERFRKENVVDAVKFMQIWETMDANDDGYINSNELQDFLKSLGVAEENTSEFSKHIINIYDKNKDGKLGLTELGNLLQNGQNILQAFIDGEELSKKRFDEIFKKYDKDNNGTIQGCELLGFLKDMKATQDEDTESKDLKEYRRWILSQADTDGDEALSKEELEKLFFGSDE